MEGIFGWVGEFIKWIAAWIPTWIQVDANEQAIKHKGWRNREVVLVKPGIRWYWPAFSQIEGPCRVVWQPLITSTINVMDKNGATVAARGFAVWRVKDLVRYAVENEGAQSMLDDMVCAAIREVLTSKTVEDVQENSRKTADNALLREVRELTEEVGVEIKLVRLTTFTKTRVLSVLGDDPPAVVEEEPDSEE